MNESDKNITVKVWNYDYSLAISILYLIEEGSVKVIKKGTLENEIDAILYERQLSKDEFDSVLTIVNSMNLGELLEKYEDTSIDDGDIKKIYIKDSEGNEKHIQVSNVYVEELSHLVNLLNWLVKNEDFVIYYESN